MIYLVITVKIMEIQNKVILFYMNKIPPTPHSFLHFSIFCSRLRMPIESEIMDRFRHARCLNDHIDPFYMIGSFASGANASLVGKIRTKELFHYCQ